MIDPSWFSESARVSLPSYVDFWETVTGTSRVPSRLNVYNDYVRELFTKALAADCHTAESREALSATLGFLLCHAIFPDINNPARGRSKNSLHGQLFCDKGGTVLFSKKDLRLDLIKNCGSEEEVPREVGSKSINIMRQMIGTLIESVPG